MQKEVTLEPGSSERVTFTVIPTEAGIYIASLDGLSGSFTTQEGVIITGIGFYDATANIWISIGESVAVGHTIRGEAITINNADVMIMYDIHTWWVDPSGAERSHVYDPTYDVDRTFGPMPGQVSSSTADDIIVDQAGTWYFYGKVELIPESNVVLVGEEQYRALIVA